MAKRAKKAKKAATAVKLVGLGFRGCRRPIITDPAVVGLHPQVFAKLDANTKKKVSAATREGRAAVRKTVADANRTIANISKSGG